MNYEKNYWDLIKSAKSKRRNKKEGHFENHHIEMKSLRPDLKDSSDNQVLLTPREHYLAHYLLWKFNPCKQTAWAFLMMNEFNKGRRRTRDLQSRKYETFRKSVIKDISIRITGSKFYTNGEKIIKIFKGQVPPEGFIPGMKWKTQKELEEAENIKKQKKEIREQKKLDRLEKIKNERELNMRLREKNKKENFESIEWSKKRLESLKISLETSRNGIEVVHISGSTSLKFILNNISSYIDQKVIFTGLCKSCQNIYDIGNSVFDLREEKFLCHKCKTRSTPPVVRE